MKINKQFTPTFPNTFFSSEGGLGVRRARKTSRCARFQQRTGGSPGGKAPLDLDIFFDHPEKIGHEVGFTDMTDLHGKWIQRIVFGNKDYTLQAHRGSFKSS